MHGFVLQVTASSKKRSTEAHAHTLDHPSSKAGVGNFQSQVFPPALPSPIFCLYLIFPNP